MFIAILEDEKLLASKIANKLSKNWYQVKVFNDIKSIQNTENLNFNLYIVDIKLTDWSWLDFIKFLRETKKITSPIIITSSYTDIEKKIYWLWIWADDYLGKPFAPDELLARVQALLRRAYNVSENNIIKYRKFSYDTKNKIIKKSWEIINLNKKEMEMLELFILNKWELVKKSKLISTIWWNFENISIRDNTINVNLSRIRAKLWDDFELKTIAWQWYKLEK